MIEPWVSTWSRPIYMRLHHEPFDPDAKDWNVCVPLTPCLSFGVHSTAFQTSFPSYEEKFFETARSRQGRAEQAPAERHP